MVGYGGGGGVGGPVANLHNNDYKIGLVFKRFLFNEKLSLIK